MRYLSQQITFQEVPDEISLSFLITGCPIKCKGCHSSDSWSARKGEILNTEVLTEFIKKYQYAITCVLFLGGEWHPSEIIELLKVARDSQLKTCLYTGLDDVSADIKKELTYLKTGSWKKELGGLSETYTNQKLIHLESGQILNSYFTAQGGQHGKTYRKSDQRKDTIHKPLFAES